MHASVDPSGFTCIGCGFRYPWVASYAPNVARCLACVKKLPGIRRGRAAQAEKRRRCLDCKAFLRKAHATRICLPCQYMHDVEGLANGRAAAAAKRAAVRHE
jgi:hypothetical protein